MTERTALIAGATGLVGGHCLTELLGDHRYSKVVALSRRKLGRTHDKLETLVVDFDDLRKHRDALGADDVFLCLGSTIKKAGSQRRFREIDYGYNLAVAQAAQLAGARQVLLVSAVGATPRARTFYMQVKGELEAAISVLPYRSHHVFRPSMLLGDRAESRPLESVGSVLTRVAAVAMIGGLRRYRPVHAETVAQAMVAAAIKADPGSHVYRWPEMLKLAGIAS
jgi:uncharacterized protein YbjT (DUF2867 family)